MYNPAIMAQTPPSAIKMLVVDDDAIFRSRLVRALTLRGYQTYEADGGDAAIELARIHRPQRAVVDMRMPRMGGLDVISELVAIVPDIRVVVLTGYGSIATAVEAVKRGVIDYLTKPVDTEQILAAFEDATEEADARSAGGEVEGTPSLARVEYEHIQRILADCGGNISMAARKLGIHRRSLQRKLHKLPPLE